MNPPWRNLGGASVLQKSLCLVFWGLLLAEFLSMQAQGRNGTDCANGAGCEYVRLSEILIITPQPYDPSQVAEARQKAESVREEIRKGGDFGQIAKANSQGPSAAFGGDVGYFRHGELPQSLEDVTFLMKVGEISDVIRTKQGFVIVQVSDRQTQSSRPSLEPLNSPMTPSLKSYIQSVEGQIQHNWYSSIPMRGQTKTGTVTIQFSIERDGTLGTLRVSSSSGDDELDKAAMVAIRSIKSFPAVPATVRADHLLLRINFLYNPARRKG
jgi:TonB family protein